MALIRKSHLVALQLSCLLSLERLLHLLPLQLSLLANTFDLDPLILLVLVTYRPLLALSGSNRLAEVTLGA